jgi:hypothetical protein
MKDYTLKEKVAYYEKRLNDQSLTEGQRNHALAFLEGVDEQKNNLKGRRLTVPQLERIIEVDKSSIALNKQYGTPAHFQGYLAVSTQYLKDLIGG